MTEKQFRALLKIEGKQLQVRVILLEAEKKLVWHVADVVGPIKHLNSDDSILFWGTPFPSVRGAVNDTRERYYLYRNAQHD